MENFIAFNPTKLHFGKDVVETMSENLSGEKNVLLMYGKGSVLRNGSYHATREQLKKLNMVITEYNGIKSNPLASDVDDAASLGIKNNVELIVAVGGGSVIDSAKITALAIAEKAKAWDIMKGKIEVKNAIPLVGVLTLAATGTEMNPVAVLQNSDTQEKIGYRHQLMFPQHSFLDPSYTLSVPANFTSYGIVDLISHAMENFFSEGDASLTDRFIEAIIKEAMEYGPSLMNNLDSYDLRSRIMWAATNALNGLTGHGKTSGDWGVHLLGHVLSFLYDTPHGATLSIVYPAWLKKMKERIPDRISNLGIRLFGNDDVDLTIKGIEAFFSRINSPVRLEQAGIGVEKKDEILSLMNKNEAQGVIHKLANEDRNEILAYMYSG